MKTKAFSDMRFTLGHRDYSERNTEKEDITDHINKPSPSKQFGSTPI